jgi:hypothetical protein
MRAKLKGPGSCIFCGGSRLTKEHIFSNWLKSLLPSTDVHTQTLADPFAKENPVTQKTRPGTLTQWKIRKVCAICNSGWMSQIVNRSKPFVESLILDQPIELDRQAQTSLAAWIAIATIMAEFTDSRTAAIPPGDRKILKATEQPPATWTIFAGRYRGEKFGSGSHYRHAASGFQYAGSSQPDKFQFTTYALETFLVHAFSSTNSRLAAAMREAFSPDKMIRIWPTADKVISWPASPVIEDDHIDDLSLRGFLSLVKGMPR